jgi:hypothetical protein
MRKLHPPSAGLRFRYSSDIEDSAVAALQTMGDVMALEGAEEYGYMMKKLSYIYVFKYNDIYYRIIADVPQDISDEIWNLDSFNDDAYEEKYNELVSWIPIDHIEDLSSAIPTQEELDSLIGMTGEDLLAAGWYISYYIEETGEVVMGYTPYAFTVVFDGDVEIDEDSEEDFDIIVEARNEAIRPLTVVSVTYFRIGDALSYE